MADTHETIADIIAEMRGMGNYQRYSGDHARVLAGRIEAAHRRERGNCAKLREALVKCRDIALQWQADEAAGVAGTTDKPHARSTAEAVIDMEFEINAALSTPPRNCDVMDWRTAWKMWREKFHPETPVGYSAVVKGTEAFMDWFAAPATEKEGGAK